MAQIFVFEELDEATREYLLKVRDSQGRGMPGVFIKKANALPVVGFILGPIIIAVTLCLSLATPQIYSEPAGLALLQTAGLLLGGWMVLGGIRAKIAGHSRTSAGYWVYADPLFLYEATAEQVAVTPMSGVTEATAVHNIKDKAYQNTIVTMKFTDTPTRTLTLVDQRRSEAVVQFYNFCAWSRGPEGFGSNSVTPAVLGGLAKYVTKNDSLPLDAGGAVDLSAIELEIQEIPTDPQRTGSASPHLLIYAFLLVASVCCYFVMKQIDIPMRDDAVYELVTAEPKQPEYLRQYLTDDRNTLHREEIYTALGPFYDRVIVQVDKKVRDAQLKAGMTQLLKSLKRADQPVVSLRVTEAGTPPKEEAGKKKREEEIRNSFVQNVAGGMTALWIAEKPRFDLLDPKPPKMGDQLINFVEAPPETTPHIDIRYQFIPEPDTAKQYHMKVTITIRDDIQGPNVWKSDVITLRPVLVPLWDNPQWSALFTGDLCKAMTGMVLSPNP